MNTTPTVFTTPTNARYDVCGIGNAIVDILARVPDAFLQDRHLHKGAMQLMSAEQAEALYQGLTPVAECSGGSVANTIAHMASQKARVAYQGRVHRDERGVLFVDNMQQTGVTCHAPASDSGAATAYSVICITPDGERTMCTYLGACTEFTRSDIHDDLIIQAGITYIEGYLWDQQAAKDAITHAISTAHKAGRKVAFTLSDSFCVERHLQEFNTLVREHVDILFANEDEILRLSGKNTLEDAIHHIAPNVSLLAVTASAKGAYIAYNAVVSHVPTQAITTPVDVTGAGDAFAAGMLAGICKGLSPEASAAQGNMLASMVIGHIGARDIAA